MVLKTQVRDQFITEAGLDSEEACDRALKFDDNDHSVLGECGKLFRYFRKIERSRELLEKALSTRPVSTGYHHLGLAYTFLATNEKYKDVDKKPGYYRKLGSRDQQSRRRGALRGQTLPN